MKKVAILVVAALPIVAAAQAPDSVKDPALACKAEMWKDARVKGAIKMLLMDFRSPAALKETRKANKAEQASMLFLAEENTRCENDADEDRRRLASPEQYGALRDFERETMLSAVKLGTGRISWAEFYEANNNANDKVNARLAAIKAKDDQALREFNERAAAAKAAQQAEEQRQAQAREIIELERQKIAQQAAIENERNRIMEDQARQANINNAFNNLINATQPRFAPPAVAPSFNCSSRTYGQTTYTNCR